MAGTAVVVGAGVAGLAVAVGLRRAGWSVEIVERRGGTQRYGTAFGIHPTAQAALDRLGLGEALRRRAVPYRRARIRTPAGTVLARLPLDRIERRAGRPELLIARPHLIDLLETELDALGGGSPRFGETTGAADARTAAADLLVGADGIGSTVRSAFFGDRSRPRALGAAAWIGVADLETDLHGETWGDGRFFGMTPIEPGRTNWYATAPADATAEDVRAALAHWHDPVPRVLAATGPSAVIRYPMRHLYPALPSFVRDGRVALVGDAAHAMTPNLGQGACTALLDAEALTRAVAAAGPRGLPGALRRYDAERRRSAQRVALGSRVLHRFATTAHIRLRNGVLRLAPA